MDDDALLAAGDHATLYAKYAGVVLARCQARIQNRHDAEDVAQLVWLRILREQKEGMRYPLPFFFALQQIVTWAIGAYFQRRRDDEPLEGYLLADHSDPFSAVVAREWMTELFTRLPPGQRRVCELRYLEVLEVRVIAERLDIRPNAVYQRLHNAHERLRELFEDE